MNRLFIRLYTFLWAGSIAAINPWGSFLNHLGTGRGETWTHPKIFFVILLTLCNLFRVIASRHLLKFKENSVAISRIQTICCLWILYLTILAVSVLVSPFPIHSLLGQATLGDGLFYWVLIAVFYVANSLLLMAKPELIKAQIAGLLLGGCIAVLSIFPQLLDWRIDYTITSGQIMFGESNLLKSGIWQMQMPIGLYSNRGHTAFVLATIFVLSIIGRWRTWIANSLLIAISILTGVALLATQVRAGIIALVIGLVYLYLRSQGINHRQLHIKRLKKAGIAILLLSGLIGILGVLLIYAWPQQLDSFGTTLEGWHDGLTGRLYLWQLALQGIAQRPWLGWGADGFGIAQLFVADWSGRLSSYIPDGTSIETILSIHESTFDFISLDGEIYTGALLTYKAHNLFLDLAISSGLLGLGSYLFLFGYCLYYLIKSKKWPMAAIAIGYLVFTQTWYESAQFSHLPWWALSLGTTIHSHGERDI